MLIATPPNAIPFSEMLANSLIIINSVTGVRKNIHKLTALGPLTGNPVATSDPGLYRRSGRTSGQDELCIRYVYIYRDSVEHYLKIYTSFLLSPDKTGPRICYHATKTYSVSYQQVSRVRRRALPFAILLQLVH